MTACGHFYIHQKSIKKIGARSSQVKIVGDPIQPNLLALSKDRRFFILGQSTTLPLVLPLLAHSWVKKAVRGLAVDFPCRPVKKCLPRHRLAPYSNTLSSAEESDKLEVILSNTFLFIIPYYVFTENWINGGIPASGNKNIIIVLIT